MLDWPLSELAIFGFLTRNTPCGTFGEMSSMPFTAFPPPVKHAAHVINMIP